MTVPVTKIAERKKAEKNREIGKSRWTPADIDALKQNFLSGADRWNDAVAERIEKTLNTPRRRILNYNVLTSALTPITASLAQLSSIKNMGGAVPTYLGGLLGSGLGGSLGYLVGKSLGNTIPGLKGIHWLLSVLGAGTGGLGAAALASSLSTKDPHYLALRDSILHPTKVLTEKALSKTHKGIDRRP